MPIGLDVQMHTSSPDVVRLPKTAQFVHLSYTSTEDPSIRYRCHRDPEWLHHRIVASPPCTCHRHHYHSSMTSSSCRSSPSSCSSLWRTGCSHSTSLPRRNRDGKMPCDSSTAGVLGRILNSTCKGTDRHRRRCCMVLRLRESPILPLLPIIEIRQGFAWSVVPQRVSFPGKEQVGGFISVVASRGGRTIARPPNDKRVAILVAPTAPIGEAPAALVPPPTVVRLTAATTATAAFLPIASPSASALFSAVTGAGGNLPRSSKTRPCLSAHSRYLHLSHCPTTRVRCSYPPSGERLVSPGFLAAASFLTPSPWPTLSRSSPWWS